jgi:hypothetical protein
MSSKIKTTTSAGRLRDQVCSRFVFSCFDEIKTFFLDFPLSVSLTVVPKSGQSVYFLFSISTFRLFVQSQLLHPAK